jgi:hypothetical protein
MNEPHRSSSIISKKKEKKKVTVKVQDTIIMGALLMSIVWLVLPSTLSIPIIPTNTIIPAAFATTTNGGGITCEGETATILGTNGNNDIVGTSGSDVIAGLGGNDRIRALGGDDIVCGGAGNDDMDGGEGRDELVGNQGNDRANGGAGNDICNAESEISCNEPDTTAPVLTVPEDITEEATSAEGAVVRYEVSAEDSVDGPVGVTCTPESGSIFSIGTTTTVTCTATDAAGNTGTASFTVTVQDTTPPTITVPNDIVVQATSANGAQVTFAVSAEDNVDGTATLDGNGFTQDNVGGDISIDCTLPPGTTFPVGSTTVQCNATDAAGNTGTASFTVTVQDTTPPTITTVPEDITVQATSGSDVAVVTFEVAAEDDVDGTATLDEENTLIQDDDVGGDITITCDPSSGTEFSIGETEVECTATDAAGNTGTASFTVTVQDTTPPVLTVPGNMRVEGGGVITWEVTAQDNIDGTATLDEENTLTQDDVGGDITLSCRPPSGTEFSSGVNSHGVSCTATDVAGNTATASFRINTLL